MVTAALALSTASVAIKYDASGRRFVPAGLQARVTNIGTINDQFNVDIIDLPEGWFTRSVPGMRMRPGIDGTVDITFHPPLAPEAKAGPNPFKVRVTPQEQPDGFVEFAATLTIDPFTATTLSLAEASIESDGQAVFRVQLANAGNLVLGYTLTAQTPEEAGPNGALDLQFVSSGQLVPSLPVQVGSGETVVSELRVAAPPIGGVERSPGAYAFQVKGAALPVSAYPQLVVPPLIAPGTLVLRPGAPVAVAVSAKEIALVDLVAREGQTTISLTNPSTRLIVLLVEARSPSADLEVKITPNPVVLPPSGSAEVTVSVTRSHLAAPVPSPQRLMMPVNFKQTEPPSDLPAELASVPRAAVGAVSFTGLPLEVEVTVQPPGLQVDLEPPKRTGSVGKYKVVLKNNGVRRVRADIEADDPDRDLESVFGPQPPRWKRIFRRAKRYAAYEVEATAYRRMGAGATHMAQVADAPRASDMVDNDNADDLSQWGGYQVVLDPGNRVEVPLEVRPRRGRLVGQSRLYPFSIKTAVEGQEITSLARPGVFEHRPLPWLLIIALVLLVLSPLFIIIPLKLACDKGSLEFGPFCVAPAPLVAPPATLRQEGGPDGRTKVFLREGIELKQVAEEPAAELPGQFAKLVVPSPEKDRVLYVTAKDTMLTGATMKIGTTTSPPTALPPIEKVRLWPAKPVWCQTRPGDAGRIAYVGAVPAQGNKSGLMLRIISLGDSQLEHKTVLEGTTGSAGNGFEPNLFYGAQETPLLWWDNCNAIKYTAPNGKRWLVDLRSASASEVRQFNVPDAPVPAGRQSACEAVKPFAQTDPRWAEQVIGGTGGPPIGAAGCTLAAAATVFQYYGATTNPNQVLTGCDLSPTAALNWAEAAQKCSSGKVTKVNWSEDPKFTDVAASLAAKQPAILGLAGGPTGSHYVIAIEGNGGSSGDYRIQDPWDGSSYKQLSDYLETGTYRLKWLVRFEGTAPLCAVGPGPSGATVNFAGIQDGATSQTPVKVTYDAPGGNVTASSPSGQTFDKEGFHNIRVLLADGTYRSLSFFVDGKAPVTSGSFVQDKDKLGGVLTLTAKDTFTPVAQTRYQLQLEGQTEKDYLGNVKDQGQLLAKGVRIEVKAIGEYTAMVYSVDAAGNKETPRQIKFKVEGKPPTPQLTPGQLNLLRDKVDGVLTLAALEGVGELAWKAEADQSSRAWVTIEPSQGTLASGKQQQLKVKIDRSKIPNGAFSAQIIVSSTSGATDLTATAEVLGEVVGPPPASATATAAIAVVATAAAGGTPAGGRGACSPNQIPHIDQQTTTISLTQQLGSVTFRDANNQCIMWYAKEGPAWIAMEAEQKNKASGNLEAVDLPVDPSGAHKITTQAGDTSKLTIRPDWAAIRAGTFTEAQIVLEEDSDAHRQVTLLVKVAADRRSITIEVVG